jgi:molybdate/tungstate transport system ATP-binding protein
VAIVPVVMIAIVLRRADRSRNSGPAIVELKAVVLVRHGRLLALIAVHELVLRQGAFALTGASFTVPTGKYGVLMGKTGSGKTSILEAIAGLRKCVSGRIVLGERDVSGLAAAQRGVGYVPQDGALFPTMTVREHLAFAMVIRRAAGAEIEQRTRELAEWLHIAHLLERKSFGLSGGEAQRVALGRALSFRPRFLLMDEPLSSLDEETHAQLTELLLELRRRAEVTVLHVTHSRREAEMLADLLFRLEKGRVTPEQ